MWTSSWSPRRQRDRGAASLEYAASVVIVGTLVLAVSTAFLGMTPAVGPTVRWAVCEIATLGLGGCERPPEVASPHVPTKPCVTESSTTTVNREIAVVIVTGSNSNRYEVARLSDGRYRVTELKGGSLGAEAGVGGGVTVTYNDQQYGASASADAGAALQVRGGRVWYTDSETEASRLIGNLQGDAIADSVTGPATRPVYDAGRWLVDRATGHDSSYPPADEFAVEGGVTLNAGAEAVGILTGGSASADTATLLGARETRDGHVTVYVRNELSAAVAGQYLDLDPASFGADGAGASGKIVLITAVTVDNSGALSDVTTTAAASGQATGIVTALFDGTGDPSFANQQGAGIVFQASLPIRSAADARVAGEYLLNAGITQVGVGTLGVVDLVPAGVVPGSLPGSVVDFLGATRERGVLTRQTFTENSGGIGVSAEGKIGIELGAGASVETLERTSTGASYWDGVAWAEWTACE